MKNLAEISSKMEEPITKVRDLAVAIARMVETTVDQDLACAVQRLAWQIKETANGELSEIHGAIFKLARED